MESFKRVESRSSKKNKKPEFNSSRVSPIPNGNSQWGDFNVSKSFNPMFGSSKKFFSASVLGSRIVSWATSLISRRSSPPRSTTPTPTLGGLTSLKIVVDDAKRIYDSLSQEVTRLRQQLLLFTLARGIAISPAKSSVENLTLKAQLQEVELETVKEVIKSLTAGNRSSGQSRQGQSKTTTRNGGRTKEGDSRNDNEWVVQDKPGVYITHTSLPGGVIDLKRVRFSRRRFSETQAEQWWAENRARVYKQYNVCEVDKSSVASSFFFFFFTYNMMWSIVLSGSRTGNNGGGSPAMAMGLVLDSFWHGVYVGGALHWVVSRNYESDSVNILVAAFDLTNEEYRLVPQLEFSDEDFYICIRELDGCLYIFCNYDQVRVDVLVMTNHYPNHQLHLHRTILPPPPPSPSPVPLPPRTIFHIML
ncbi:hypothetical protein TEA_002255 [Camellia sinensis var. sinensis]|uniref:BRX domain-containing protein n=1 Tax=Camellia sinensis var. sinensis TaxID=542762 RepID=A0A4V3WR17_CAMSN|nr:hypothetical protein TEA_002255 [Camellia sinensis var. sinensis]